MARRRLVSGSVGSELGIHSQKSRRSLYGEFKQFVRQGSFVELAVAMVVGAAFTQLVDSFVQDIFTPVIGLVMMSQLSESFVTLKPGPNSPYNTREDAQRDGAVTWNYGNFIQCIFNFLLISVTFFMIVKAYRLILEEFEDPEASPPSSLLIEQDDLM